jgi:hypothetical protein
MANRPKSAGIYQRDADFRETDRRAYDARCGRGNARDGGYTLLKSGEHQFAEDIRNGNYAGMDPVNGRAGKNRPRVSEPFANPDIRDDLKAAKRRRATPF